MYVTLGCVCLCEHGRRIQEFTVLGTKVDNPAYASVYAHVNCVRPSITTQPYRTMENNTRILQK